VRYTIHFEMERSGPNEWKEFALDAAKPAPWLDAAAPAFPFDPHMPAVSASARIRLVDDPVDTYL
jgi:hypothetical protein